MPCRMPVPAPCMPSTRATSAMTRIYADSQPDHLGRGRFELTQRLLNASTASSWLRSRAKASPKSSTTQESPATRLSAASCAVRAARCACTGWPAPHRLPMRMLMATADSVKSDLTLDFRPQPTSERQGSLPDSRHRDSADCASRLCSLTQHGRAHAYPEQSAGCT